MNEPKKPALSNTLIVTGFTTVVCYFIFIVTKHAINSSVYGAFTINFDNFLFIIPTSTLVATIIGALVFGVLSSFLHGVVEPEQDKKFSLKPRLSKKVQVFALAVIAMYSAFHLQEEILSASQHGIVGIDVLPDFTIVIPSVVLITVILGWLVFIIMMEFVSSLSKDAGAKHSDDLKKVASGAFLKEDNKAE